MAKEIEVIARGAAFRQGQVLLCQNRKAGYYYLPGGHVEFGEASAKALAREFEEECGLTIRVKECALVSEGTFLTGRTPHHEVNVLFHVELNSSEVKSKEEHIAFEWVDLAAAVDMDIRPESIRAWLASGGATQLQWVSEVI